MTRLALISTAVLMAGCAQQTDGALPLAYGEVINGCQKISQQEWKKIKWLNVGKTQTRRKLKDEFKVSGVAVEAKGKKTRKRIMQKNGVMYVLADQGTFVGFRDDNKNVAYVDVKENAALYWDGETVKCKAA